MEEATSATSLRGRVATGIGDFGQWIRKYDRLYREQTGMWLYPGTLNVRLDHDWPLPCQRQRFEIAGTGFWVNLVPCRFLGRPAFIVRTENSEASASPGERSTIEILSDVRLRDHFNLADGDIVEVEVTGEVHRG